MHNPWWRTALIFIAYALCASSFSLAKVALDYSTPLFLVGFRMLVAGLLLYLVCLASGLTQPIKRKDMPAFGAIVLFHIYGTYVLDLLSLQYLDAAISAFLFNLSPFITALLAYVVLRERITRKKWLGLCVGFSGIALALLGTPLNAAIGSGKWWPELLLLGAIVSSCIGWVFVKKLMIHDYSFMYINSLGMLGGGFLALLTSAYTENWYGAVPVVEWWPFLALTAALIVVCNCLFYNMYGYLLRYYSTTFLSFAGFTCPLFVVLFQFIFFGQWPDVLFWYSFAIVSLGLYIFYIDELRFAATRV
ncbi:MAG: DMT family transporter [Candidatus Babeliales bacterium]